MRREIQISDAVKNLIIIQKTFGFGTQAADIIYRALSEQKLLELNMEKAATQLKADAKYISALKEYNKKSVQKVIDDCLDNDIKILSILDDKYPEILKNIHQPPLVLYFKGEFPLFDENPSICIVGPRKASQYGLKAAYSLGYRMAKSGMIVVSGGALGCDSAAHKGALKAKGSTVAVLGCGIGNSYLSKNKELRDEIAASNCIISEFPPFMPVKRFSFPVRNRILSGLCDATVVVEASEESGALITARHANDQGREVFVIPGNPSLECYKGSNNLLRDGATPLIEAADIFNEYILHYPDKIDIKRAYEKEINTVDAKKEINIKKIQKKSVEGLSNEAKIVYNNLNRQSFTADDITCDDLSDDEILSALTELEIEHFIAAIPGGSYILV